MGYLSAASHAAILAAPERLREIYEEARATFLANLGPGFAGQCEDHLRLAFCAITAFDLKPYGACRVHDLPGLLAAPALDCDNYVSLAWHLFRLMRPLSPTRVAAVGWDGGAVGNHAQMQGQTAGSPDIYLDPTIGLVVHGCSLDALCQGYRYGPQLLASFWPFAPKPSIAGADPTIRNAIMAGAYKASDLLYLIRDHRTLREPPPRVGWLTPRA